MPLNIILPSMTTLHKDPHTQFCMHQQSHTCSVNVLVLTHIQITKIRSNFTSLIVHVPIWKMSAPDKFNFTYITIMALHNNNGTTIQCHGKCVSTAALLLAYRKDENYLDCHNSYAMHTFSNLFVSVILHIFWCVEYLL
jgi:hypothetical protein